MYDIENLLRFIIAHATDDILMANNTFLGGSGCGEAKDYPDFKHYIHEREEWKKWAQEALDMVEREKEWESKLRELLGD